MELDKLAIVLRPRNSWEAMDLGVTMLRRWWRSIFAVWFTFYIPVALVLFLWLGQYKAIYAVLALWWLRPLFDRPILYVLSNAVFGHTPNVGETLKASPLFLRNGLLIAVVLRWLLPETFFIRSLCLPVRQLEGQTKYEARQRMRVLYKNIFGHAWMLSMVCFTLEVIMLLVLTGFVDLLTPELYETNPDSLGFLSPLFQESTFAEILVAAIFFIIPTTLIEPLYVAAGFALYLNRRSSLEGWDLELAFRRIGEKLPRRQANSGMKQVGGVLFFCGTLIMMLSSSNVIAQHATQPKEIIKEILKQPEFDQYENSKTWQYKGEGFGWNFSQEKEKNKPSRWAKLGRIAAEIMRVVLWILLAVAISLAIIYADRWLAWAGWKKAKTPDKSLHTVFGLDISPESLPTHIAEAAFALIARQQFIAALSLLYRGALAKLIERDHLEIHNGDTESDCINQVRRNTTSSLADYFSALVKAWQQCAYAHKKPNSDSVIALCRQWGSYFGVNQSS